ncbi:MAG: hypothetical protein AAF250_08440 [Pseudomonadota bacterium]
MTVEFRKWACLGLATALAGAGLSGCAGDAGEGGEADTGSPTAQSGEAGEGEGVESGGDVGALPAPQRVAFMSGHVAAGLALYRSGRSEEAAPHLMHPVSETHEAERAGLAELGFDAAPFEAVSKALEAGKPAEDVEPQIEAAQANLVTVRNAAGGNTAEIIRFLMDTAVEEYAIAVPDDTVTDAGEYHDAWGFVTVARQMADDLDGPKVDAVKANLDEMIALWPGDAPITPETPAPKEQISTLASRVILDLPQ